MTEGMRNVLGRDVQLDDAFLDRMRQTIDPPADAVAKTVVEQNLHRLIGDLIKKREMWDPDGEPSRLLPEEDFLPDLAISSVIGCRSVDFLGIRPQRISSESTDYTPWGWPDRDRAGALTPRPSCGTQ